MKRTLARGWPEVAFLLALGLSALAVYSSHHATEVERATKMREISAHLSNAIDHRLGMFESAVINTRSFVLARGIDSFTNQEFRWFVDGLEVANHYPGLRAIGFVCHRPAAHPAARLTQVEPGGAEEYDYSLDLYADPRRAGGLDLARDTDDFSLTERLDDALGTPREHGSYEGYLPVYEPSRPLTSVADRRHALRGWVYAAFIAPEILAQIATDLRKVVSEVGLEVYDGLDVRPDRQIYREDVRPEREYVQPVEVLRKRIANRVWTVRIKPTLATFNQAGWPVTLYVAALGLLASTWIYVSTRSTKRYARSLEQSEGMLSLVINSVPAMISYIGQDERYVYANHGYERVTGRPRAEIAGLSVRELLGPDIYARLSPNLRRALAGERTTFEHDFFHLAGVTRVMAGQYIPHRNAAGEVAGVVALVNDVTDERLSQEKLRAVARDNAKLYNEAQAVNRVKDEFLATLSHELRTPLNVILGYSELLSEEPLGSEARAFVETIHRNAQTQNQLIADLLDISAIITGKLTFQPAPVNLTEIVHGALEGVAFAAGAKGVRLEPRIESKSCAIVGDATRLQQIVWNLLSNAIKFTPGGGEVTLTLNQSDDRCVIEVQDTGIGIDAEFLPYVFDRFRQEDSGRSRRFGGLGLGLSIVRHLVELHGGQIWVQSAGKDQGSRFTVSLPRSERTLRLTTKPLAQA